MTSRTRPAASRVPGAKSSATRDRVTVTLPPAACRNGGKVTPTDEVFLAISGRDGQRLHTALPLTWEQAVGDAVRVRYDPSNPEQAKIDSLVSLWSPAVGSIIFGLVVLVCTFSAVRPWRAFRARGRPKYA